MKRRKEEPTGGTVRAREVLEARPNVIADDGTEYEVIWFAHRDAMSLLPDDPIETRHEDHTQIRGSIRAGFTKGPDIDEWSWLG